MTPSPSRRLPEAAEVAAMREAGYLVVPGFFDADETRALVALTGEVAARPEVAAARWSITRTA